STTGVSVAGDCAWHVAPEPGAASALAPSDVQTTAMTARMGTPFRGGLSSVAATLALLTSQHTHPDAMHFHYTCRMKTTQLPPLRVAPAVRQEIEGCLDEGETLSQFIEKATVNAARTRLAQQAFLERGRASLARATRKRNG